MTTNNSKPSNAKSQAAGSPSMTTPSQPCSGAASGASAGKGKRPPRYEDAPSDIAAVIDELRDTLREHNLAYGCLFVATHKGHKDYPSTMLLVNDALPRELRLHMLADMKESVEGTIEFERKRGTH